MRTFFLIIVLVVLGYAAGFLIFLARLPNQPGRPYADGIVALTGGGARLDTAVGLLEQGVGQRLLISGVDKETTKVVLGHIAGGGPRFVCCADIGYAADDTHGNAEEAAEWAREHRFNSLLIVTARYHMPRAMREFENLMPDAQLTAYPVEQGSLDLDGWWRRPRTVAVLNREYVKYLATLAVTTLVRRGAHREPRPA